MEDDLKAHDSELRAGFAWFARSSPYLDNAVGPLQWRSGEDGEFFLGLMVRERHTNSRGTAHGGLLSVLADVALGHAIGRLAENAVPTTASMNMDFMRPAGRDRWLEARVRIQRIGKTLAFSSCEIFCEDEMAARGSATFAMISRARPG